MAGPGGPIWGRRPFRAPPQEGPPHIPSDWQPSQYPRLDESARMGAGGFHEVPLSSRAPINVALGRRTAIGVGAGAAIGLAGLGAAIGLSEGIPALAGGQGPLNSAINPDKQEGTPGGPPVGAGLFDNPLLVLGLVAAVVLVVVFK